jgi:hypothetical protein
MVFLTSFVNDRKHLEIFWRFNTHFSKMILDLLRHGEPEGGRLYRGNLLDDP